MKNNHKEENNKKENTQKINKNVTNNSDNNKLIVKKEKPFKEKRAKWLRQTSLTVVLILLIVAACIGINILVEEINIADFDFTQEKIYSLSDMTKSMTSSIDKNIEIMIINPDKINEMIGTNYNGIEEVAKKYNSINDKITVEVINDINSIPDIAEKYGFTADSPGVIVKNKEEEKEKVLSIYDIYISDYSTNQVKNMAEEALTNAIIDVTTEEKQKIYYLTGHEKYSTDSIYYFMMDLEEEAYEFNELDILTKGEVPDDCSVLMLTSMAEDITKVERDAILDYINKGGKIFLAVDPNLTGKKMPNFQKVLDQYGIELSEGVMLEEDTDRMLLGTPNAILVTVSPYTSVTKETNMNMNACFINSGKIEIADSEELEELGVEVETLATTGEESEMASATVGALLKKKIDDNNTSEMVVYANNFFITNEPVQINQQSAFAALDLYNNEDLAMNTIAYLTERNNMITIRKTLETTTYNVTEQQNIIILSIIFTIPVLIIIIGIIVWQIRRRKK